MLWKVGLRSVTESRSRVCRGSDTSDRDLSDGRLLCLPRADALPRGSKYQSAQCLSHSGAALYVRVYVRVSVRPSVRPSVARSLRLSSPPRPCLGRLLHGNRLFISFLAGAAITHPASAIAAAAVGH